MKHLNFLDWTAFTLVVIGGLNWALFGLFEYDVVNEIFGTLTGPTRAIYTLIGLAAVYVAALLPMLMKHRMGETHSV